jgi:hypothetical protein
LKLVGIHGLGARVEDLRLDPALVGRAAGAAQEVADEVPSKVAHGFQATEECAALHRGLPCGVAVGSDMQAWSDRLIALSNTIAATAQQLRQATAHYLYTDASAAADLDRAAGDLGMG